MKNKKIGMYILAGVIVLALFALANSFVYAYSFGKCNGSEPPNPSDDNLNWNIANATTCTDEYITINGNITISTGGSLTLRWVNLSINCSPSTGIACGFNVTAGSNGLFIYNSTIVSNGSNYTFQVFAPLEIKNSLIKDIGANRPGFVDDGVYLGYPAIIEDSIINHSFIGIIIASNSTNITRTNFTNISSAAITDDNTQNVFSVNTKVEDSIFSDIGKGGSTDAAIILRTTTVTNNITLIRVKIINITRGFFDSRALWFIANSTIENGVLGDIRIDDGNITLLNTTLNRSKITWSANVVGNITFKWYVTVNITDKSSIPIAGVNISAYRNDTSVIEWTKFTGADGSTNATETIEGITADGYNASFNFYLNKSLSPYNFTANKSGYKLDFIRLDINKSTVIVMILDQFPTVTALNFPPNLSNLSSPNVSINFTATDDLNATNCTIYINRTGAWQVNGTVNVTNNTIATINLTNLNDGYYIWSIECIDNSSSSDFFDSNFTFTIDTIATNLTNVSNSSITYNTAVITWNTGESGNSSIRYGGSTSTMTSITADTARVLSHSITLGLSASTTYYYNATSCDSAGNCNTSGIFNFTTSSAPEPETTPPASPPGAGSSPPAPAPTPPPSTPPEAPQAQESEAKTISAMASFGGYSNLTALEEKIKRVREVITDNRTFIVEANKTIKEHIINTTNWLYNFSYFEEIPKCVVELIKKGLLNESEIKFPTEFNESFRIEVIREDPLIVWHFTEVSGPIDISWEINKNLSEECLKQIQGTPYADIIGPSISKYLEIGAVERLEPPRKKSFAWFVIVGLFGSLFVISALIFMERHGQPKTSKEKKEEVLEFPKGEKAEKWKKKPALSLTQIIGDYVKDIHIPKIHFQKPHWTELYEKDLWGMIERVKVYFTTISMPEIHWPKASIRKLHIPDLSLEKKKIKQEMEGQRQGVETRLRDVRAKLEGFSKEIIYEVEHVFDHHPKEYLEMEKPAVTEQQPQKIQYDQMPKLSHQQKRKLRELVKKSFKATPLEKYEESSTALVESIREHVGLGYDYKEIDSMLESEGWDREDVKRAYRIAVAL